MVLSYVSDCLGGGGSKMTLLFQIIQLAIVESSVCGNVESNKQTKTHFPPNIRISEFLRKS